MNMFHDKNIVIPSRYHDAVQSREASPVICFNVNRLIDSLISALVLVLALFTGNL